MPAEFMSKRRTMLPCQLTDKEVLARQEALVKSTEQREVRESALESWKSSKKLEQEVFQAEISSVAHECFRLAKVIKEREERREVEIEDWIDGSTVYTVRKDTGEEINRRAATEAELQRTLLPPMNPTPEGKEPAKKKRKAKR